MDLEGNMAFVSFFFFFFFFLHKMERGGEGRRGGEEMKIKISRGRLFFKRKEEWKEFKSLVGFGTQLSFPDRQKLTTAKGL